MSFLRRRSGQGTTEYIVIIAIAVFLIMLLWKPIKTAMTTKVSEITTGITAAGR